MLLDTLVSFGTVFQNLWSSLFTKSVACTLHQPSEPLVKGGNVDTSCFGYGPLVHVAFCPEVHCLLYVSLCPLLDVLPFVGTICTLIYLMGLHFGFGSTLAPFFENLSSPWCLNGKKNLVWVSHLMSWLMQMGREGVSLKKITSYICSSYTGRGMKGLTFVLTWTQHMSNDTKKYRSSK